MKKILAALGFVTLAGVLLFGVPAQATQSPTVHHPECEGTLVKDQPPHSGLSVTVPDGYLNVTMYLKIGKQHVEVPVVSSGETYGPNELSSWPRNKKWQPLEISHVDYCVPKVPETTLPPETTVPPTTAPSETTAPPVTTVPATTVPPTTAPPTTLSVATPSATMVPDPVPAASSKQLPSTGSNAQAALVTLGVLLTAGGFATVVLTRRRT